MLSSKKLPLQLVYTMALDELMALLAQMWRSRTKNCVPLRYHLHIECQGKMELALALCRVFYKQRSML
jgi:hypothetical protein